jgi:hypothetical protein
MAKAEEEEREERAALAIVQVLQRPLLPPLN